VNPSHSEVKSVLYEKVYTYVCSIINLTPLPTTVLLVKNHASSPIVLLQPTWVLTFLRSLQYFPSRIRASDTVIHSPPVSLPLTGMAFHCYKLDTARARVLSFRKRCAFLLATNPTYIKPTKPSAKPSAQPAPAEGPAQRRKQVPYSRMRARSQITSTERGKAGRA
jgi:hypothetical protein